LLGAFLAAAFTLVPTFAGAYTSTNYRAQVDVSFRTVRDLHGAYVFGTLFSGQDMAVTGRTDDNFWLWGYARGYVNKCGWMIHGGTHNAGAFPSGATNCDTISPYKDYHMVPPTYFSNGGAQYPRGKPGVNGCGNNGAPWYFPNSHSRWWDWDYSANWGVHATGIGVFGWENNLLRYRVACGWGGGANCVWQGIMGRACNGNWSWCDEWQWHQDTGIAPHSDAYGSLSAACTIKYPRGSDNEEAGN
jgi:hypothetical protein